MVLLVLHVMFRECYYSQQLLGQPTVSWHTMHLLAAGCAICEKNTYVYIQYRLYPKSKENNIMHALPYPFQQKKTKKNRRLGGGAREGLAS